MRDAFTVFALAAAVGTVDQHHDRKSGFAQARLCIQQRRAQAGQNRVSTAPYSATSAKLRSFEHLGEFAVARLSDGKPHAALEIGFDADTRQHDRPSGD